MSDQECDEVFDLLINETGDLTDEATALFEMLFARFDVDKDGKLSLEELQAFAVATNGEPFPDEEIKDMTEFFQVDDDGRLTRDGFLDIYHTQTMARPEDTKKDLQTLGLWDGLVATKPRSSSPKQSK